MINKIHPPSECASQVLQELAERLKNGTEANREVEVQKYLAENQHRLEEAQNEIVEIDGRAIKYIQDPFESTQLIAINKDPIFAIYIKSLSPKVRALAIKLKAIMATILEGSSEADLIHAVSRDPSIIKKIKNPSKPVQFATVRTNSIFLIDIKAPAPEVEIEAIELDHELFFRVKKLSYEAQIHFIKKDPSLIDQEVNFTFEPEVIALSIKLRAEEFQ